ncbi:site-specific DNA-methyltransferase [Granulicella tundricola]|uniref:site-specific DNA-methyltransferase (adenine-specific) n=1 Tax=Granulicella tundricola (strain ATCC BAA-1859 / DSM 23138 / MP5ACTX9) TaxID=1198114 RepID=E8X4Y5_GRATM|nr:site-specific DNA-methyltransferase [Granulicella tundricola]ADW67177.1 DNA methylase N-4/N-6 domain protein [Granulicella tundricola MP5ACTX9]
MAEKKSTGTTAKTVTTLVHDDASRKNIPTAEFQSVMRTEEQRPTRVAYERRNRDLDPQLIWRGKYPGDDMDAEQPLTVPAPPLYIQEKVHPKVLIDDLKRETERQRAAGSGGAQVGQIDLFADFNGLPNMDAKTEFYQHDQHWSNRMILGDSLQVMASLAEREGLRGKVQCIYFDPPYGIKFNSNFQWSTTSRDVKDGNVGHITREPEQVKAFRDTWRDGIHSYLSYLRDRLVAARDMLTDSGSIFVQIGDENSHRVRALLDEVFGPDNAVSEIAFSKTTGLGAKFLSSRFDFLLWYAKDKDQAKFRRPYLSKSHEAGTADTYFWIRNEAGQYRALTRNEKDAMMIPAGYELYKAGDLTSQGNTPIDFTFQAADYTLRSKTPLAGLVRLAKAGRIHKAANSIQYVRKLSDFRAIQVSQLWDDTGTGSFTDDKLYVVQTGTKTIQRCILMTTDPGDLVLDPTCGSGSTAYVAEQWGRRWITVDTSRVALALARARVMGARYAYYLLTDSIEGRRKDAELRNSATVALSTYGDVRQGFVCERVPRITLGSIANNLEIDVFWDEYQTRLEPLRERLNTLLHKKWQEWEIPQEVSDAWSKDAKEAHAAWWNQRTARQRAIDASIAAKAEFENLYDKPYEDKNKVRVAGPFTVESLSPHRVLEMQDNDLRQSALSDYDDPRDVGNFVQVILDTLKASGVQQTDKNARIEFTSLQPWPGLGMICAEGHYTDKDGVGKRAGIMIGPEFGTVARPDLAQAAREAGDAGFDVVIACAFNFDAQSADFTRLGRIPVLKARMNADLHMAEDLKNTGKGNLFIIFGEPEIEILLAPDNEIRVKLNGIDVFNPSTGEVTSSEPDEIACWFVDTDYNEESFFVRHAYFLGANDPYKSLKTTLKAEINQEAWESLHSDTSRPFPKPATGRIAVKVINHLGDEVMKVFTVA